jgi:hypothetical protein
VGSKTLAMVFFVVRVNRRYNLLLGRDCIHDNGCVSSMLHQCLVQWIGNEVEVMSVKRSVCIVATEAQSDAQDGSTVCLSG